MKDGALKVGLMRTNKKEQKFGGPCKTHRRIWRYFKISNYKPEVRECFGYLCPVGRIGFRTLKEEMYICMW